MMEHREDIALNVYVAMCYFKLDIYDVSLEILAVYLQSFPDSVIGINLKACNHFRLYNGKAAEQELRVLQEKGINLQAHDLIRHNLVVFSNGDQALQVCEDTWRRCMRSTEGLTRVWLCVACVACVW